MTIQPIKDTTVTDDNTSFELVELADDGGIGYLTPHCKVHRAMNKVAVYRNKVGGIWRCLQHGCRAGCEEYLNT